MNAPAQAAGTAPKMDLRTEVRVQRDGFIRLRDVDYSVPPGLSGRRVQVRLAPREVVVHLEGVEIARHRRSFAPADVVLDPRHARELRLGREARSRLERGDVELGGVDLGRYDDVVGLDGTEPPGPDVQDDLERGSQGFSAAGSAEELA